MASAVDSEVALPLVVPPTAPSRNKLRSMVSSVACKTTKSMLDDDDDDDDDDCCGDILGCRLA